MVVSKSIDPQIAANFGFPKPHYTVVERERRWLCNAVPRHRVIHTDAITDLYVTGTRLRLREARPADGGPPMLRLTRKTDIDAHTRLLSSIYLPEDEFALLARAFTGLKISKHRHRIGQREGFSLAVDEFHGELKGLILAEAEFDTPENMQAFEMPDFATREITNDPRYTGGHLAKHGLPKD